MALDWIVLHWVEIVYFILGGLITWALFTIPAGENRLWLILFVAFWAWLYLYPHLKPLEF